MNMMADIETLFHRDWYLTENPDAEAFPGGALAHYTLFGWREGLLPHAGYVPAGVGTRGGDQAPLFLELNHCAGREGGAMCVSVKEGHTVKGQVG